MPKKAKREKFKRITGQVVRGDGRGQALGFPTANLRLEDPTSRPPDGIYAGWAQLEGETAWRPAAVHVGPRPTFIGAAPSVEVHILDYTGGPLYGRRLAVQWGRCLRAIRAFSSTAALQRAIAADIQHARTVLAENQPLAEAGS